MQSLNNGKEMAYRQPSAVEETIGIFLNDPTLFIENKRKVTADMFGNYQWIYNSMLELEEQDGLTYKALIRLHPFQAKELHEMRECVLSNGRLPSLIEKLKKEYLESQIYGITQLDIAGRDPNEVLSELQSRINQLSNTEATELHDTDKDLDDFFDWIEEIIEDPSKAFGLLTGIDELDRMTTGFHRGDFIVIGARTSVGKSAFMIEIALSLAKNGYKVAIYSLEMSKRQLYYRMLANLMTLDLKMIKSGRMLPQRLTEMRRHKEFLKNIYIDDTRAISADYITDSMRRLKRTRGIDAVMTDYIQDVKENGESNDNGGSALARVCRKLRKGAQEMDVAMFGLSQVNRNVEERKDKRPMPSDLTGSAGIESSADVIALLYRDDYYDAESDKKGVMEVNFAKQRNAEVGKVELYYERRYQQLRSLSGGKY